jgi:hypothetical protein
MLFEKHSGIWYVFKENIKDDIMGEVHFNEDVNRTQG